MELTIFARFHARDGQSEAVAAALREVVAPTRAEPGCLAIEAYRSTADPGLFYIHSRWIDEAAFEVHAGLPHTARFVSRVQPLIDHPVDVTRARPLARRGTPGRGVVSLVSQIGPVDKHGVQPPKVVR